MFLLVLDFEDDLVTIILQTFIFSCTPHTGAQCDKEHIIAKEKKKRPSFKASAFRAVLYFQVKSLASLKHLLMCLRKPNFS